MKSKKAAPKAPARSEHHKPRTVPTLAEPPSLEPLAEAEREIGINDWLDPETGEPAEGQSPPHLVDE